MRKFITIITLIVSAYCAQAQSKLGLKFSPTIASNRIALVDSLLDVEKNASKFKFSVGLIYDLELSDTYYFSTGLVLVPKSVSFSVSEEPGTATTYIGEPQEAYNLQYLQIPLTLKLYTNEIMPDGRIYFQVGGAMEFLVNEEPTNEDYTLIREFKSVDTSIIGAVGFEYRAGINTSLYGGFSYQRGLSNTVKTMTVDFQDELFIRNTLVSLDLGIKF
ncbi:MAG: porin family protein [Cyclobacteriaceae bacterium]